MFWHFMVNLTTNLTSRVILSAQFVTAVLKAFGGLVVRKLFTTFKLSVTGDKETGRKTRTLQNREPLQIRRFKDLVNSISFL